MTPSTLHHPFEPDRRGSHRAHHNQEVIFVTATPIDARELALLCTNAALTKKAKQLTILRVTELSSFTDYFIICSGNSDRQVKAITETIETELKKSGALPLGVEGARSGRWSLIDYGDVVVHVFLEPVREFYDIERLWSDAPAMVVDDDTLYVAALNDGL